jgi:hypothetical protein
MCIFFTSKTEWGISDVIKPAFEGMFRASELIIETHTEMMQLNIA